MQYKNLPYDEIELIAQDDRIEAIWRAKLEREVYDYADKVRRSSTNAATGVAIGSIIEQAGSLIGKMPMPEWES